MPYITVEGGALTDEQKEEYAQGRAAIHALRSE